MATRGISTSARSPTTAPARCRIASPSGTPSPYIRTTTPSGRRARSGSTPRTSRRPCCSSVAGTTSKIPTACCVSIAACRTTVRARSRCSWWDHGRTVAGIAPTSRPSAPSPTAAPPASSFATRLARQRSDACSRITVKASRSGERSCSKPAPINGGASTRGRPKPPRRVRSTCVRTGASPSRPREMRKHAARRLSRSPTAT